MTQDPDTRAGGSSRASAIYSDIPDDFMNEGNEVVAGREPPPHTQSPDWVSLADIDALAGKLHTLLKAHVNQLRGDARVWPSTRSLARMLRLSRRDKVGPLLKQLVGIGAIEISRAGTMPARNVYVVHSLPPEGYAGPLSVADWYERNREALKEEAAVDKAKRDGRATRNKQDETGAQVTPVTPPARQQAVTPPARQQGAASGGQHVAALEGRKQDEVEPDEQNNEKPPADAGRGDSSHSVQTTIDGEGEDLSPKAETPTERAFGIAQGWVKYRKKIGKPIGHPNPVHAVKSLALRFTPEFTDDEIKRALNGLGEALPSSGMVQRALDTIRDRKPVGVGGRPRQRGAGADVNAYWEAKEPDGQVAPAVPVGAIAGIQTTGAQW